MTWEQFGTFPIQFIVCHPSLLKIHDANGLVSLPIYQRKGRPKKNNLHTCLFFFLLFWQERGMYLPPKNVRCTCLFFPPHILQCSDIWYFRCFHQHFILKNADTLRSHDSSWTPPLQFLAWLVQFIYIYIYLYGYSNLYIYLWKENSGSCNN